MTLRALRSRIPLVGKFLLAQLLLIGIDKLLLSTSHSFHATCQIAEFAKAIEEATLKLPSLILTGDSDKDKNPKPGKRLFNLKRRAGQAKDYHKSKVNVAPLKEMDCSETHFMSAFHYPVNIVLNSSIYDRQDKFCSWHFVGSEPCIPTLTCDVSKVTRKCDKEYLEIVDGTGGSMKICGGNVDTVKNVQASGDLRDLYLHYKILKKAKSPSGNIFSCNVICSKRGNGTQLEKTFENAKKVNPNCCEWSSICGTKPNEDRIMNGETAQKFEFPWLVTLVETNTRQPFCGGSIINNRFVQTAGHCIKGKFSDYRNIQVIINGHVFDQSPNTNVVSEDKAEVKKYPLDKLEEMDKTNGSKRFNVDEIIVHPLYVAENNDFDLSLLKLADDIDLSFKKLDASMESILQQPRQICLPPPGSYLRTFADKKAVVAGWGLPEVEADGTMETLQKLQVHVFSPGDCKKMFAHRVNRRMICAGYKEGGKDSCVGDSGGPLVLEDRPKVWYQIGSVSFGEGCGVEEHPGVYFRTTEGVQWITYQSNYHASRADELEDESATWCVTPS